MRAIVGRTDQVLENTDTSCDARLLPAHQLRHKLESFINTKGRANPQGGGCRDIKPDPEVCQFGKAMSAGRVGGEEAHSGMHMAGDQESSS